MNHQESVQARVFLDQVGQAADSCCQKLITILSSSDSSTLSAQDSEKTNYPLDTLELYTLSR